MAWAGWEIQEGGYQVLRKLGCLIASLAYKLQVSNLLEIAGVAGMVDEVRKQEIRLMRCWDV